MYLEGNLQLVRRARFHECLSAEDDDEVGDESRDDLLEGGERRLTVDIAGEVVRNGGQRDVSKDEIREGRHGREYVSGSKEDVAKKPPEISNDSARAFGCRQLPASVGFRTCFS